MSPKAPTTPPHILSLSKEEKREFINSFDFVFCDCDGVIWDLEKIIEGSGEAINLLKTAGKRFVYVSNNSVRPADNFLSQFKQAGVETDLNDIMLPVRGIVDYLKEISFKGLIYCIATEVFKNVIKDAGFHVIDGPNKILEESFRDLAINIFDKQPVRAVIMDVDFNLSAAKLMRAQQYLRHPDCILIAGATDKLFPVKQDITIIGPGSFLNVLVDATAKSPVILGKPGKEFGRVIKNRYGVTNPKRVLVIGDMLQQDIAFGKACGFQTLVVLSGGCKRKDLDEERPNHETPHYYADSISDFTEFYEILAENKKQDS